MHDRPPVLPRHGGAPRCQRVPFTVEMRGSDIGEQKDRNVRPRHGVDITLIRDGNHVTDVPNARRFKIVAAHDVVEKPCATGLEGFLTMVSPQISRGDIEAARGECSEEL